MTRARQAEYEAAEAELEAAKRQVPRGRPRTWESLKFQLFACISPNSYLILIISIYHIKLYYLGLSHFKRVKSGSYINHPFVNSKPRIRDLKDLAF